MRKKGMDGSEILVIYSSENTQGVKDATGAFIPEAKALAKLYEVPKDNMLAVPCVSLRPNQRLEAVCQFLRGHSGIRWLTFFGHGWSSGIQFGIGLKNLPVLTQYLSYACSSDLCVTLYACSTASTSRSTRNPRAPGTDNGFADKLRDNMLSVDFEGGWVDAHLNPGHTARNPFVVRFYTLPRFEKDYDLPGGEWLVSPKSSFWQEWQKEVRSVKSLFRFRFPLMTEAEIYHYLMQISSKLTQPW